MMPPMPQGPGPGAGAQPSASPPGAPPIGGGNPLLSLLGGGIPQGQPNANPEMMMQATFARIRDLHMQIDQLARQFPAAAQELEMAKQALTGAMAKIAATSTQAPGQPAPQSF